MRTVHKTLILCMAFTMASTAWAAGGGGLKTQIDDPAWARWQARIALGTAPPLWRAGLSTLEPMGLRVNTLAVTGDYYLTGNLLERAALGGLRATSALIVGPRSQSTIGQPSSGAQGSGFSIERRLLATSSSLASGEVESASTPYFGFGYTGLSLRGNWSFSADMGMVALSPGNAVRLGRVLGGTQSLDDMLRDMRLAPVLQMGVSYAF
jgi:hypothetical protein